MFYFFTLSKGIDDAQLFLGYVLSTNLLFAFCSLQHHVHVRHRLDYDKQKASVARGGVSKCGTRLEPILRGHTQWREQQFLRRVIKSQS